MTLVAWSIDAVNSLRVSKSTGIASGSIIRFVLGLEGWDHLPFVAWIIGRGSFDLCHPGEAVPIGACASIKKTGRSRSSSSHRLPSSNEIPSRPAIKDIGEFRYGLRCPSMERPLYGLPNVLVKKRALSALKQCGIRLTFRAHVIGRAYRVRPIHLKGSAVD